MKMIANIIVVVSCLGFIGWCLYTGSEAEDRREEVVAQQQAHDLQAARMSRTSAFGPEAVEAK